jgi:hypothetical protein
MTSRLRSEAGQALVAVTLFMTLLLGACAIAIDVGTWYLEQRRAQAAADAAALAGAQALPYDGSAAIALAKSFADKNGGGLEPDGISIESDFGPGDTIVVDVARTAPGYFAKLFGIDSANVGATSAARSALPAKARWAAPIVVNKLHPLLSGPGCPCFETTTTLPLEKTGAPGAFGLVNLDQFGSGSVGASEIADWILHGFDGYLDIGDYLSAPGAKWNNSIIQDALWDRLGDELLFPVFDVLTGQGSNAAYRVIGWVGFRIASVTAQGTEGTITGKFTRVIWDGIQNETVATGPDFGVRSINLVS